MEVVIIAKILQTNDLAPNSSKQVSYGQESFLSRRGSRQIIDNAYFTAIIFKTKEMSPTSAAGLIESVFSYLLTILTTVRLELKQNQLVGVSCL